MELNNKEIIGYGHGIYKITNIVNGKFYIGSAIKLIKRKADHFSKLSLNKHSNIFLQNAYNKYGKESFIFEVIERTSDKNELINLEQKWLDKLNPFGDIGYNICRNARSALGRKLSKETIEKIKKSNKGRKSTPEQIEKMRNTKLSQKLTMPQYLKDKLSEINRIRMTGKKMSEETKKKLSDLYKGKPNLHLKGKKRLKEHIEKTAKALRGRKAHNAKKICQYDMNDNLITIHDSMRAAALSLNNISYSRNIFTVCIGKQKTAYKFKWKYHES